MMTTIASMPKIIQGGGRGGGTGSGPHAAEQSWQEQEPEPSSKPSVQAQVLLFIGVKPDTLTSMQGDGKRKRLENVSANCIDVLNTEKCACVRDRKKLPENIGMIGNGVCPLSVLNMYWIHSVALHMLPVVTHISFRALTLLEGAWTSLQALYMAAKKKKKGKIP